MLKNACRFGLYFLMKTEGKHKIKDNKTQVVCQIYSPFETRQIKTCTDNL